MFVIHVVQVVKAKKVKKKDVKTIVSYNFFVVMGGCTKVKKIKVASVFGGGFKVHNWGGGDKFALCKTNV